jgi:HD-GYP domain-containing protein (c-di-GMP phosphodiesterase class II)
VPGLAGVALLVRCHHERWDGRGYPHGLARERIPVGARVLAACDVWWALTGDRPYAPAIDPEDAALELQAAAGSQLDPEVVETLLAVLAHPAVAALA